jgi:hypothetical protein
MRPLVKFRILAAVIVLVTGGFMLGNLYAELLRPSPPYSFTTARIHQSASSMLATTIAPLRTDLKADLALVSPLELCRARPSLCPMSKSSRATGGKARASRWPP